jgi:hypothetical protein
MSKPNLRPQEIGQTNGTPKQQNGIWGDVLARAWLKVDEVLTDPKTYMCAAFAGFVTACAVDAASAVAHASQYATLIDVERLSPGAPIQLHYSAPSIPSPAEAVLDHPVETGFGVAVGVIVAESYSAFARELAEGMPAEAEEQ